MVIVEVSEILGIYLKDARYSLVWPPRPSAPALWQPSTDDFHMHAPRRLSGWRRHRNTKSQTCLFAARIHRESVLIATTEPPYARWRYTVCRRDQTSRRLYEDWIPSDAILSVASLLALGQPGAWQQAAVIVDAHPAASGPQHMHRRSVISGVYILDSASGRLIGAAVITMTTPSTPIDNKRPGVELQLDSQHNSHHRATGRSQLA